MATAEEVGGKGRRNATMSEDEITAKLPELRDGFLLKYKGNVNGGKYDRRDMGRLRADDPYAKCFIRSHYDAKAGAKKAIERVDKVFAFRKEIRLNDVTEASFPPQVIERNALYWDGVDNAERKILHFKVMRHQKGKLMDDVKKNIAFVLDQYQKMAPGAKIVLIFDFSGAEVKHMDMDIVKYIIACVCKYFPCLLAYILLFELPGLLAAAWKVIQSSLSEEEKKSIIPVNKKLIKKYINDDQLQPHMQSAEGDDD